MISATESCFNKIQTDLELLNLQIKITSTIVNSNRIIGNDTHAGKNQTEQSLNDETFRIFSSKIDSYQKILNRVKKNLSRMRKLTKATSSKT
jgi:hypothetical protein